ncbi:short-subunit dehydrogenase [Fluviicoccus keumensis]|uniref:Short-subunit dehydrogenase n=1 Tax=Fluviicoccus keumensis TaxID=1435465 RepID=A0A4Q7YPQ4_9GAMM|nr:SDR family oxidoreductase [Fluviicoccus keumensis]RZU38695.1 short-subunit dehydrogenase [Fluviicoccus keumensis]
MMWSSTTPNGDSAMRSRTFWTDKLCFITGAASGIGKAVATAAARRGARLLLTDIRAEELEHTAAEIRAGGGRVEFLRAADIADYDAVKAMADEIHARFGSVDVVMNIAGISIWGRIQDLEHRHWRDCVEVNLMGPIQVLECFVPPMIRAGRGGAVVNVSSAAGLFGLPWHAAYSASKFGLRGVSEVLRYDLARHGIQVSLVCPGAVDTGLVRTVRIVGVERDDPRMQALTGRFQKHAMSPEQAAAAILRGVERGKYLVFTSPDIAVGHWFQRKFAWPYELVMRGLNAYAEQVRGG